MKLSDMIELGLANLWRTRLRTLLTTLGVVIGIGALTSMISFGTGMERNITETNEKNDLFTSLHVTPGKIDLEGMREGDMAGLAADLESKPVVLTDSVIELIRMVEGVEIAYPELSFRAKLYLGEKEREVTVTGIPMELRDHPPFDEITFGSFLDHDSSMQVLIRWETLKRMDVLVEDPETPVELNPFEEERKWEIIEADSLIGSPVKITTAVLDKDRFAFSALGMLSGRMNDLPVSEHETRLVISGIIKRKSQFSNTGEVKGDLLVPFRTANEIPRLGFTNIWEILGNRKETAGYPSIYVKVSDVAAMDAVVRELREDMGLNVFAISDQLREIRRAFLILDGILGAIGTIALIVAGLGIVNTMLMSILERTREIGIMKAIGGSERQIKWIFFVEAGTIGFLGAILGLLLGKAVTILANQIANSQFLPAGEPPVNFFYFPLWLILGAIGFSILLSMAAGLYPAIRAARVDPVRALRHD